MRSMATKELITVADIADALGVPGQVHAVKEGLIADGLTILEDWAGRPAVTFTDAKATVDRHRKQQADWEERARREQAEAFEAADCQREFDRIAGLALPMLRKANPFAVSHQDQAAQTRMAWEIARQTVAEKYSPQAIARLSLKPISWIEADENATNAIGSVGVDARQAREVRARVNAALGIGTE